MARRITDQQMRSLIQTDTSIDVEPFIINASILVDRIVAEAGNISVSTSEQQSIEANLAAHFYAIAYPKGWEKEAGRSRVQYQGKHDLGFDYTPWGQTAKVLDPTGYLASIDEGAVSVSGDWLGTEESEAL